MRFVCGWRFRLKNKLTCQMWGVWCEMAHAGFCSLLCSCHVFPMCLGHSLQPLLVHSPCTPETARSCDPLSPCLVCMGLKQERSCSEGGLRSRGVMCSELSWMRFLFQFRLTSLPLQLCSVICTTLFDSCLAWATKRVKNSWEVQMKKDPCSIIFPVPCTESEGLARPF